MPNKPQDMGDIFAEEEARLKAEHEAWLADPAEQAKYAVKVEALVARMDALPDEPEAEEIDEPEDEDEDEDEED